MKQEDVLYYTIYDNRTDEIYVYGTRDECAKKLGMKKGSFSSMISNIKSGTRKYHNYSVVIETIDSSSLDDVADD